MCIFLCRHLFSSFFCKCQGAQLLGHMIRVCLVYKKPPICLPKCLYYFASLPAMYERSCCSIPSPAFGVVSVLDTDHFNRCIVVSLLFYCSIVALFFFFIILVIYLFSAVLGSHCCMDFALAVASSAALAVLCRLLIGIASPVGKYRLLGLQFCGSWAPEHGLNSCDAWP